MKIKDQKAKESLIKYINENPELRLWQAIRNWGPFNYIWGSNQLDGSDAIDTFHLQSELHNEK